MKLKDLKENSVPGENAQEEDPDYSGNPYRGSLYLLATFVDEQLADVRCTYDPKVARLAKRRKVMVMKGAFDKL